MHLSDISQLDRYVTEIPPAAATLAEHFWPGPLTLLLPKKSCVPDVVTAGLPRVAVRVTEIRHESGRWVAQAVLGRLPRLPAMPLEGHLHSQRPAQKTHQNDL